ncbi:hypothetical protein E3Q24_03836 [Wallemia mellicola]|nr:hypothetical protein E3Q24_03836 [Wallemia mellicola]TIC28263.1 putative U4/U6.U5 tri-snRNP-associated protein [Wallemia mellicola]TIC35454.1 putative U4/U6.U5 tri-snRNP-associated protein [Wallemia mellicola]
MAKRNIESNLYLDTVNRHLLDFDFEKVCSVTLSNKSIYCCLICGKYYQGRSKTSAAYNHSIDEEHHVYLGLDSKQFYILPENYKVDDNSLADILKVLEPSYESGDLDKLDSDLVGQDLSKNDYLVGYIGLNNMSNNDYANVILNMLTHIRPLRNHFLLLNDCKTELLRRYSLFNKRVWNDKLFKSQVSPHEVLQLITKLSANKFNIQNSSDPVEFLTFLLNQLHKDLGGNKKPNSSIIYQLFQGQLRMTSQKIIQLDENEDINKKFIKEDKVTTINTPFLILSCDLPPKPVFNDNENIIPQVSLGDVLKKYDGVTTQEHLGQSRQYKLTKLPKYLLIHFKRFSKNRFTSEYNQTIVNYPISGVDFKDYVDSTENINTVYDLVGNISHEHQATAGDDNNKSKWKCQLKSPMKNDDGSSKWFQLQDLFVEEIDRRLIFLGETYLQEHADVHPGMAKKRVDRVDKVMSYL